MTEFNFDDVLGSVKNGKPFAGCRGESCCFETCTTVEFKARIMR